MSSPFWMTMSLPVKLPSCVSVIRPSSWNVHLEAPFKITPAATKKSQMESSSRNYGNIAQTRIFAFGDKKRSSIPRDTFGKRGADCSGNVGFAVSNAPVLEDAANL